MLSADMQPIYGGTDVVGVNFDGCIAYQGYSKTKQSVNYTQIFRTGIIEAVDAYLLQCDDKKLAIPSQAYEAVLVRALRRYLSTLVQLGVAPPIWVCLSLLNMQGYCMGVDSPFWFRTAHAIDRGELILPEIRVEDPNIPAESILKPAFDSIWNACGYERSMNYDEGGNWQPKGR